MSRTAAGTSTTATPRHFGQRTRLPANDASICNLRAQVGHLKTIIIIVSAYGYFLKN